MAVLVLWNLQGLILRANNSSNSAEVRFDVSGRTNQAPTAKKEPTPLQYDDDRATREGQRRCRAGQGGKKARGSQEEESRFEIPVPFRLVDHVRNQDSPSSSEDGRASVCPSGGILSKALRGSLGKISVCCGGGSL
jgi:hypothetical protein